MILKKKDTKRYNYKAHIVVSVTVQVCVHCMCVLGLTTLYHVSLRVHVHVGEQVSSAVLHPFSLSLSFPSHTNTQASELCLEESQSSANRTCFWIYSRNRRQIKYLIDPHSNSKRTEWVNTINDLTRKFSQDLEEEYGQFVSERNTVLWGRTIVLSL